MAIRVFLCVFLASFLLTGSAQAAKAEASDGDGCQKVKAIGVGQDLGNNMTTATISRGGILNGTTAAQFTITSFATFPDLPFSGQIVFTTKHGTLTLDLVGTFNALTGEFSGTGTPSAGTGRFAGATGELVLTGIEDFSTGAFTETITGTLCLADDDDDDGDDD